MKLKKILSCLCLLILCGCSQAEQKIPDSVYGMWFSYLDYEEMFHDQDEKEMQADLTAAVENMQGLGINTVYIHACAFTDAFYNSAIYPRTASLPGIDYDPLALFVRAAHQAGLQAEAWINPLRSVAVGEEGNLPEDSQIRMWIERNDERVRQVNGRWYLNPAYPEVRALVVSVVREVLDNYDVDGIHFDDYFYPEGTDRRFDAYIFGLAADQEDISRESFRTAQINELVQEVHTVCAEHNKRFTISTSGNMENNLTLYYADPAAWVKAGTVDILIPQIYWGYGHPVKPYAETLDEWLAVTAESDVMLAAGLAAYKIGTEDQWAGNAASEWTDSDDMLARQTRTALEKGCVGAAYFRYGSLFVAENQNTAGEIEHLRAEIRK